MHIWHTVSEKNQCLTEKEQNNKNKSTGHNLDFTETSVPSLQTRPPFRHMPHCSFAALNFLCRYEAEPLQPGSGARHLARSSAVKEATNTGSLAAVGPQAGWTKAGLGCAGRGRAAALRGVCEGEEPGALRRRRPAGWWAPAPLAGGRAGELEGEAHRSPQGAQPPPDTAATGWQQPL